jgi:hypothetical protein
MSILVESYTDLTPEEAEEVVDELVRYLHGLIEETCHERVFVRYPADREEYIWLYGEEGSDLSYWDRYEREEEWRRDLEMEIAGYHINEYMEPEYVPEPEYWITYEEREIEHYMNTGFLYSP